jgi:hypothetical protein
MARAIGGAGAQYQTGVNTFAYTPAGAANATANASSVGSGIARASAITAGNGGGAANASSTSTGSGLSVVTSAAAPFAGTTTGFGAASAYTQTTIGGSASLFNGFSAGQSVSTATAAVGSALAAWGVMGASYRGTGAPVTYTQSASFIFASSGNPMGINLMNVDSLGAGFQTATFNVFANGSLAFTQSFSSLLDAQNFFSGNWLWVPMLAGTSNITLSFSETMNTLGGFGFSYGLADAQTPLPAALPLFASGLAALWFAGRRRKKAQASAAA